MRTPMRARLATTLAAAVVLLSLSACTGRPGPAVAILLDASGSTAGVRDRYLKEAAAVLERFTGGERLFCLAVTATSVAAPLVCDITFPKLHMLSLDPNSGNDFTHRARLKAARGEALARIGAFMAAPPPPPARGGTAIIDALFRTERLLARYGQGHRTVVVLSDQVEQTPELDLTRAPDRAGGLARLRAGRGLPDLAGTCVHAAGVTDWNGRLGAHPAGFFREVERFWREFYAAAGAELHGFGPELVDFRLCPPSQR